MKHIVMSFSGEYGTDPVPAYRVRRKDFLPVVGVLPASIEVGGPSILPEGEFQVIRKKEDGAVVVVPGSDNTGRCLLFVGCRSGPRGGVGIIIEETTGVLIKNITNPAVIDDFDGLSIEVAVILNTDQSVVFHTFGINTNHVICYTWNGTEVVMDRVSKFEWDTRVTLKKGDFDTL